MSEPAGATVAEAPLVRLFCALDPPPSVVERVLAWQRRELEAAGGAGGRLRPVRPEALHLTLAFLGELPAAAAEAAAAEVEALPAEPVEAELGGAPVPIPARGPRLLALELQSPAAERLQARLATALQTLGLYRPDQRPFWPHMTVFRLRRRGSGGARGAPSPPVGPLGGGDGHAFGFVRAALYRSDLGPSGSTYYRLAARELLQPGGRQKR